MARIQNEEFMLLACSGRARLNVHRGHVYLVQTRDGLPLDFLPEEKVYEKYGKPRCYMTSSDTLCPSCFNDIIGIGQIDIRGVTLS